MTNTQVFSQLSEAEKHSHTYPQLCLVRGNLSPEEPSAATCLHDHYKTRVLGGLQICPLSSSSIIKLNIPYIFLNLYTL